jgi:cytochrome c-type biogenesis protein CcmH
MPAVIFRLNKLLYLLSSQVSARTLLAGAVFALLLTACAVTPEYYTGLDARAQSLNKNIMCPICPGESIDQSQATIALQMREIVREKLSEGQSDAQIRNFFVDRYGPSVLMEPPTDGFSILAWIVPPVVVVLAIVAFLLAIKGMRGNEQRTELADSGNGPSDPDNLERYYQRIEAALEPSLTRATTTGNDASNGTEESNG